MKANTLLKAIGITGGAVLALLAAICVANAETLAPVPATWLKSRTKPVAAVTYECFCGKYTLIVQHRRDKKYPKRTNAFIYGAMQCYPGAYPQSSWGKNGESRFVTLTGCGRFHVGWYLGRVKLQIYKHIL